MTLINVIYALLKTDKLRLAHNLSSVYIDYQLQQAQEEQNQKGTHLCISKTSRSLALCRVDLAVGINKLNPIKTFCLVNLFCKRPCQQDDEHVLQIFAHDQHTYTLVVSACVWEVVCESGLQHTFNIYFGCHREQATFLGRKMRVALIQI